MRVLLLVATLGCGDNRDPLVVPPELVEVALVPAHPTRDVDVLFVVQDSCCVLEKQIALKAALPTFFDELAASAGGLPSLHLGVVSTDLGTTSVNDEQPAAPIGTCGPGSCSGTGRGALLQTNGTSLVTGTFIRDVANADGTRDTNYTGPLVDALRETLSLGASGCGVEQPLRAAELALTQPANAGFLRADAALAVVLLAEDEDCSVASTQLFDPDTSTLGPLSTFRCVRYGVTCDVGGETPDEMNVPGAKSECHANEDSAYVMPVAPYAARLESFKSDPRSIVFATIGGPPTPFEVTLTSPPGGGELIPALGSSCMKEGTNGPTIAQPGTRLAQATSAFRRHLYASACDGDYLPTMSTVGRMIREALGDSCLREGLALPADCEVADELADGTRTPIPPCSTTQSADCYALVEDPACSTSHRLRVDVVRASEPASDTMVSVRCRL